VFKQHPVFQFLGMVTAHDANLAEFDFNDRDQYSIYRVQYTPPVLF